MSLFSEMTGEKFFGFFSGMSVLDGGEEVADERLDSLLELELSMSDELVGGEEASGEGF